MKKKKKATFNAVTVKAKGLPIKHDITETYVMAIESHFIISEILKPYKAEVIKSISDDLGEQIMKAL